MYLSLAQRDRYKDRLTIAESSLLTLQQALDVATSSKKQVESDNLALYSKIRYLQSYNYQSQSKSNKSSISTHFSPKAMKISNNRSYNNEIDKYGNIIDEENGGETEERYHSLYEKNLNPFTEFSEFEKTRKIQELSVGDRIVLNTALTVISSTTGRKFLTIYLGLMHVLMFFILYYVSHSVHHGCDSNLDRAHGLN
jgi:homeobox protein cut-like